MMRTLTIACLIAAMGAVSGCKDKKSSGSGGVVDSTKDAADITHPKEPPREGKWWTKDEVKAYIWDSLGLKDIQLTPTGNNGFTGTAKSSTGATVQLKVIQEPGKITCEHETPGPAGPLKGSVSFQKK